jgi:plasmid stability protein
MQPKWLRPCVREILMSSITIKDVPDRLLERLRRRAQADKRSMNREAIHLLGLALAGQSVDQGVGGKIQDVENQIKAWRKLAGQWDSDLDTASEIERMYAARTPGRRVDL